jgi:ABC-type multidrug transport system fused ATPase/permease subunit
MDKPEGPKHFYDQSIAAINETLTALKSRRTLVSWARVMLILLLIYLLVTLWPSGIASMAMAIIPVLIVFGLLVSYTVGLDDKIIHQKLLKQINEDELAGLNHRYPAVFDGARYIPRLGSSGNDLDIFGPSCLYPYLNRAFTEHGRDILADWLLTTPSREQVMQKQGAIKTLRDQPHWRQQLQAYSMRTPVTINSLNTINLWLGAKGQNFDKPIWWIIRFLVPVISWTLVIIYWFDYIPDGAFNIGMLLILAFAFWIGKLISGEYGQLSRIVSELESFGHILHTVEEGKFTDPYLQSLQNRLDDKNNASQKIKTLRKILNRFDYRLNPVVYIPLSIFLLWDLQQIFALEKWKKSQSGQINHWYEVTGEMEALSTLANLSFNHPAWTFPSISNEWFEFKGEAMGHPLIPAAKSVTNDFALKGTGQFIILTGSNMAGKSTFLRTLGTNMLLAMTGGPVNAAEFTVPVIKVMSSMRITDNLEEETSTFYAELKKLKTILEAVKNHERIFLLLDEMLRGTNAIDRHTGSVALIRQLIKYEAVGIIASHDISLTALADEFPGKIGNYHFDSTVENNEIIFDYKLKNGICTSTNATLLMKKIGINIEDD